MAKKKWYVVTKGTAVGVFGTWLEVVPLVSGVSGARHQSFPTKEEAMRAFSDELIKGRVKVVDVASSASSNGSSSPRSASWTAALPPRRSQSYGSVSPSPSSGSNRPVKRSTSELAYIDDRYNGSIRRGSGGQEQVSSNSLRTPSCMSPAATVRTPSSLGQYPSERSTNTSPVSAASSSGGGLLLSSFRLTDTPNSRGVVSRGSQSSQDPFGVALPAPVCDDCITKIQQKCIHCIQTIEESSDDPLSNSFSQIHVAYDQGMDPRSPMAKKGHLPASTSSISFGRPSPEPSGHGGSGSLRCDHVGAFYEEKNVTEI